MLLAGSGPDAATVSLLARSRASFSYQCRPSRNRPNRQQREAEVDPRRLTQRSVVVLHHDVAAGPRAGRTSVPAALRRGPARPRACRRTRRPRTSVRAEDERASIRHRDVGLEALEVGQEVGAARELGELLRLGFGAAFRLVRDERALDRGPELGELLVIRPAFPSSVMFVHRCDRRLRRVVHDLLHLPPGRTTLGLFSGVAVVIQTDRQQHHEARQARARRRGSRGARRGSSRAAGTPTRRTGRSRRW